MSTELQRRTKAHEETVGLARALVKTARSDERADPVGRAPPARIEPYCEVREATTGGTDPLLPLAAPARADEARDPMPDPPFPPMTDDTTLAPLPPTALVAALARLEMAF